MPLLQLLQRFPQFNNILEQFKKPGVSTDNNFRDFNIMDQATGEVKKLEVTPYEQTVVQKVKGWLRKRTRRSDTWWWMRYERKKKIMSEKIIYDTKGRRRISKEIGLGKQD
jgi:hypothetical protein